MSNEEKNSPSWLSWEKAAGNDCVNHEAWRSDPQGWELLDTLPNLAEPGDTAHNFVSDSGVAYGIRIDRQEVERVLGAPLTTANWRRVAVTLDTSAAREMFARRLAAVWLKHLASNSDLSSA